MTTRLHDAPPTQLGPFWLGFDTPRSSSFVVPPKVTPRIIAALTQWPTGSEGNLCFMDMMTTRGDTHRLLRCLYPQLRSSNPMTDRWVFCSLASVDAKGDWWRKPRRTYACYHIRHRPGAAEGYFFLFLAIIVAPCRNICIHVRPSITRFANIGKPLDTQRANWTWRCGDWIDKGSDSIDATVSSAVLTAHTHIQEHELRAPRRPNYIADHVPRTSLFGYDHKALVRDNDAENKVEIWSNASLCGARGYRRRNNDMEDWLNIFGCPCAIGLCSAGAKKNLKQHCAVEIDLRQTALCLYKLNPWCYTPWSLFL